ncbi:FAD/NAD(P)-binding domain-containing protein, partial [Ramaria rubella]
PEYDYIIVGGGTGGCVLANRLSRDHGVSVLLIARGDAAIGFFIWNPLMSQYWASDAWRLLTTGLRLGGTSHINSSKYTCGLPGEYNLWAQEGHHGWSFCGVEPF